MGCTKVFYFPVGFPLNHFACLDDLELIVSAATLPWQFIGQRFACQVAYPVSNPCGISCFQFLCCHKILQNSEACAVLAFGGRVHVLYICLLYLPGNIFNHCAVSNHMTEDKEQRCLFVSNIFNDMKPKQVIALQIKGQGDYGFDIRTALGRAGHFFIFQLGVYNFADTEIDIAVLFKKIAAQIPIVVDYNLEGMLHTGKVDFVNECPIS